MNKKYIMLTLSLINLMALGVVTICFLPEQIPIHANLYCEIDGWGSRWITLLFALIPLAFVVGFMLFERYRIRRPDAQSNRKVEQIAFITLGAFLMALSWIPVAMTFLAAQDGTIRLLPTIICVPMGILMIVLGNYMAIAKQNVFFGFRTPWTLTDEEVWRKTHRKSAYWMVLGGIVILLATFAGVIFQNQVITFVGILTAVLLIALVPIVYSAWLYKKRHPKEA